jgi:isocitrate dehydrogenase
VIATLQQTLGPAAPAAATGSAAPALALRAPAAAAGLTGRRAAAASVAAGDGIGPEIMTATLRVLHAAGAALDVEPVELGRSVYEAGHTAGIAPDGFDSIRRTRVLLKGPVTTPQMGGFKSVSVTIRKALGLFAGAGSVRRRRGSGRSRRPRSSRCSGGWSAVGST